MEDNLDHESVKSGGRNLEQNFGTVHEPETIQTAEQPEQQYDNSMV